LPWLSHLKLSGYVLRAPTIKVRGQARAAARALMWGLVALLSPGCPTSIWRATCCVRPPLQNF